MNVDLSINSLYDAAVAHHRAGRLAEADAIYARILSLNPAHAEALHLRGRVRFQTGDHPAAVVYYEAAIKGNPAEARFHNSLATALQVMGRRSDAIAAYRRALELRPDQPDPICLANLGGALYQENAYPEAVVTLRRAVQLKADYAPGWNNLGLALQATGENAESERAFERAVQLQPGYVNALVNFGGLLLKEHRLVEAKTVLDRALALDARNAGAMNNLGRVNADEGEVSEAVRLFRRAVECEPRNATAHANLAYTMHFHPTATPEEIFAEQIAYASKHATHPLEPGRLRVTDRDPDRRLRVGYLSPDFREHVIGLYIEPALMHHDRSRFEVHAYADVTRPDAASARMQSRADIWRDVHALTDDALAELIRNDRIDILVDLCNHMAFNRLRVLARRVAPVQINYLAYPATSGLAAMDYAITDPHLDPPESGSQRYYSERLLWHPHSYWCYGRPAESPGVGPLPALANGYVTFASLNNSIKLNDGVLTLWGRVLNEVAGSRLLILLMGDEKSEPGRREWCARCRIPADRVDFVHLQPRERYLKTFDRADISLDPFPYNGHTSSLESFWMGVPVVGLEGQTAVSRAGVSILRNLGMPELIAKDPDEYVRIAARLAGNLEALAALRPTLRDRLLNSPIADAPAHTRGLEAAYRQAWQEWCTRPS